MTSMQGQRLWHFIQGSRVEIRKVVWPTRTETTQTALAVFVFTLIMGLFFWALDSGLLWLTGACCANAHNRKSGEYISVLKAGTSCTPTRTSSTR